MQNVTRITSSVSASTFRWAIPTLLLLVLGMFIAIGHQLSAAEPAKVNSWSGTWNNRKYNTTGALTCTVVGEQSGQWIAKFTGTGLGKPFTYTALMTPKKTGTNTTLQGTTRVDGDNYTWSGLISGDNMTGNFRSTTGNNGQFVLKANKPAAPAGK